MNIVYIIGAGTSASIDERVPVMSNFFEKCLDFININNKPLLIGFTVAEETRVFPPNPEIENISAQVRVLARVLIGSEKCTNDCEILKDLKKLRDTGILGDIEKKYKDCALDCFISQSLKNLKNPQDWPTKCPIINKIQSQLEQIVSAYKVAFKKDGKRRIANLEEVFSDLASRKEKSRDANNAYERLQFLIARIFYELDKDLSNKFSNAAHHDLSEYVTSSHQFKHTFISFNYDIWLEKALFNKGLWHPNDGHGSYHFKYYSPPLEDNVGVEDVNKPKEFSDGNQKSKVMVLKPHGSLSWRFGKDDNNGIIILESDENSCVTYNKTWDFPPAYFQEGPELSLTPLIVPPIPNKIRTHLLFRKTDQDITEIVAQTDVVVIIGWSMPETDRYTKEIFLGALNGRKEGIKKVIICDKGGMGKTLSTKFETIFRPRETRVYDEGFGRKFVDFLKEEL